MATRALPTSLQNLKALSKYDPTQANHMREMCIAVNESDQILGKISKFDAHIVPGMALHRAFSVFAFTPEKRLILQKRSNAKITFPSLWTNTCCSHPLHNENELDGAVGVQRAAVRKLRHELNITGLSEKDCLVLGKFIYKATMSESTWGEHELDYGLVIKNLCEDRIVPNPDEVSNVCSVSETELKNWIKSEPTSFSPWFSLFLKEGYLSKWWKNLDQLRIPAKLPIIRLN